MDIYAEVTKFFEEYRGEKTVIGKSADGRNLYAVKIGSGGETGISQYAIHAREWITAELALAQIRRGIARGSVWVLPLMNPDGALLVQQGISTVSAAKRAFVSRFRELSLWKANIEGVDLNVNFDARWGTGAQNVTAPAPENYIGTAPLSAPESRALAEFTLSVKPGYTLSWHTKGEEIYWEFFQPPLRKARDMRLAKLLSDETGYPLRTAKGSAGGYKDWCIEKLKIPAFTIEVGPNSLAHPIGEDALGDLLKRNLDVLARLSEEV